MGCLDENTIVSFVEGNLGAAERADAERHLAGCSECAEVIALAAGCGEAPPADGPRSQETLPRGFAIGRYVVLDLVGRGGMGEVYGAYDPQLDRKVAVKLLHRAGPGEGSDGSARARLLREAKTIARLSHPNVVTVHDAGAVADPIHGERVFLAMEFIEGETLAAWLARAPRSWREIRDVFLAAGEGLAAAHDAGFVHRDFKPQNVMVGRDGLVRVMDFGLATDGGLLGQPVDPADLEDVAPSPHTMALTKTGALIGTPLYMAPEQFLARPTDPRTDQFSFCVALHEALFGQRPFADDTLAALIDGVVGGRIREPPARARVPSFLRRLLLRGLAPDPADRWPSMRALLQALGHDPSRRSRRFATGAAALLTLVAVGIGVERVTTRGARACRGAGDRLASIWELSPGGPRRGAVERAFRATGAPFAESTWVRVSALLDEFATRWTTTYTDACEATHVRGDQSGEVLDLRMACLDGPLGRLRALTEVLSKADRTVVLEAVNAARGLPPLDRCSDVVSLRAAVPPPSDAAARSRVTTLQANLATVRALRDTGQWTTARAQVAALLEEARKAGYGPLLAEILVEQAWLEEKTGHLASSVDAAEGALFTGMAARRDDVALESASILVGVTGYHLGRPDEALRWYRLGEALLARVGPGHEQMAAWLIQDRGLTYGRQGNRRQWLDDLNRALAIKRQVLPPDHPDLALSWDSLTAAHSELGDYDAALVAANEALRVAGRAYGSDSPLLSQALGNRGEVLGLLGRHSEAQGDLRDSIARWTARVGLDHPWVAYPLTALGKSLTATAKPREAIPLLERALAIRRKAEPNKELVAESAFALADARWAAGHDPAGARTAAAEARDVYGAIPKEAKHAAEVDRWLADHPLPAATVLAARRRGQPAAR